MRALADLPVHRKSDFAFGQFEFHPAVRCRSARDSFNISRFVLRGQIILIVESRGVKVLDTVKLYEPPARRTLAGASVGSVGANDRFLKDTITITPVWASTTGILGSSPEMNSVKKPDFHEYESE